MSGMDDDILINNPEFANVSFVVFDGVEIITPSHHNYILFSVIVVLAACFVGAMFRINMCQEQASRDEEEGKYVTCWERIRSPFSVFVSR